MGLMLPVADVGIFAGAAGLAVAAQGIQVVGAVFAGLTVQVGVAPRVERHGETQVGALPVNFASGRRVERSQALFGGGVMSDVDTIVVQRLAQLTDLQARDLDLGFADLGEVARADVTYQQADDDEHDEEFQQGEAAGDRMACGVVPDGGAGCGIKRQGRGYRHGGRLTHRVENRLKRPWLLVDEKTGEAHVAIILI